MGPNPAGFGLLEGKSEGVEGFRRTQPDETVRPLLDIDSEMVGIGFAKPAVDAVGRDYQVPISPGGKVRLALMIVMDGDPQFASTI